MPVKKVSAVAKEAGSYQRPVPWRTCVVCGSKNPKRDLVRLVRDAQGEVEIDLRGKMPGRGAYLCRTQRCWQTALKSKHLEHALRAELTVQNREELSRFSKSLP